MGDERRACPRQKDATASQQQRRQGHHDHGLAHRHGQERRVGLIGEAHQQRRSGGDVTRTQDQARSGRDERQRQDQRRRQGKQHRGRHGPEHLAVHAGQRQDRHVHQQDDEHREEHRPGDRNGCAFQVFLRGLAFARFGVQRVGDGLDQDHGAIDEQAEVQGAQAHQVAGDAHDHHADGGPEHRQRNDQRHQQRRAQAAQHRQQHGHDQQTALGQILADRAQGPPDEIAAVVDLLERHVLGQERPDLGHLGVDAAHHHQRVVVAQHLYHDVDDFPATIRCCRTDARLGRLDHVGDVGHAHRGAFGRGGPDHRDGEILGAMWPRHPAQQGLRPSRGQVGAGRAADGAPQRLEQLGQRHTQPRQIDRPRHRVQGALLAAPPVHFDHAGHAAQQRRDLQLHDFQQFRLGASRSRHREVVDLAQASRQRPELGRVDFGGQRQEVQAFLHDLPGPKRVHRVVEHHRHRRQAVTRQTTLRFQARHAAQGGLDWAGDQPFDFDWSHARRPGQHQHLVGGDVGQRVETQT